MRVLFFQMLKLKSNYKYIFNETSSSNIIIPEQPTLWPIDKEGETEPIYLFIIFL